MKVIVPYTAITEQAVVDALNEFAPDAEQVYVGGERTSYWELVAKLWSEGEGFVIVEHDVEIHAKVLPEFEKCKRPWCGFPYDLETGPQMALGCTRFSTELLAEHPTVLEEAGELSDGTLAKRDWHRLDSHIAQVLTQTYGLTQHAHKPAVVHHHTYQ